LIFSILLGILKIFIIDKYQQKMYYVFVDFNKKQQNITRMV